MNETNQEMHNCIPSMPTIEEIARHEAGHAVTAHVIYELVFKCSIIPVTEDGVYYLGFTEFDRPLNLKARDPLIQRDFKFLLELLICNHAGRYFERTISGNDNEEMAGIDRLQMTLYTDERSIAVFDVFEDEILDEFCKDTPIHEMVETVTDALLIRKELIYHEIRELLLPFPFDFHKRVDELAIKFYPLYCAKFNDMNNL